MAGPWYGKNGYLLAKAIVENTHLQTIEQRILKTAPRRRLAVSRSELLSAWQDPKASKLSTTDLANLRNVSKDVAQSDSVYKLGKPVLFQLTKTLGLNTYLDLLLPAPLRLRRMQERVQRHLTLVRADDCILRQTPDLTSSLNETELESALAMRCLPQSAGKGGLDQWVRAFVEPLDAGFLCRT